MFWATDQQRFQILIPQFLHCWIFKEDPQPPAVEMYPISMTVSQINNNRQIYEFYVIIIFIQVRVTVDPEVHPTQGRSYHEWDVRLLHQAHVHSDLA